MQRQLPLPHYSPSHARPEALGKQRSRSTTFRSRQAVPMWPEWLSKATADWVGPAPSLSRAPQSRRCNAANAAHAALRLRQTFERDVDLLRIGRICRQRRGDVTRLTVGRHIRPSA